MSAHVIPLHRMGPAVAPAGRWVEVLSHLDPKYGGVSSAVPALSRRLREREGFSTSLAAFCAPGEEMVPDGFNAEQVSFWPQSRAVWRFHPLRPSDLRKRFATNLRDADGVHIHGLWEASTAVAASVARDMHVPYIISAHGMLEPWALAQRRLKKLIYSRLIERANLRRAACLHALTQAEARHYARYVSHTPIAVVPNGVDLPQRLDSALFFSRYPDLRGQRLVLFMGRLHTKKGVDMLIDAWSAVQPDWPNAHLVLAGPDSENTQAALLARVAAGAQSRSVTFTGMLRDKEKWSALAAAEVFVLPSHSEGLSMSVLEAMGAGLPVIVTDACNMPEIVEADAGWEIPVSLSALTAALRAALTQEPVMNAAMGARAHAMIQRRFTWPIVARQMAEVYRWAQGGAEPHNVLVIHP